MSAPIPESNLVNFYENLYKEFGKKRKEVDEYVDMLREWAEQQPHFPEVPSKNVCTFFVTQNKFIMEKAKKRLDMYYTIRHLVPEFYSHHPLSPEMILQNKIVSQVYLPKLTKDNEKVLVWGVNANYGPEYFHHERGIESFVQLTELLMQDETCNGFHCICDFGNIKLGHIPKFHPMALKKLTIFVEGVLGTRIKSLFLVNVFPFVDTLVNTLFKPLLPKKIISRLQISRTSDILLEHFDKAILPKDLGGEEKSLIELSDMMMKKYESMKSRFDKFNSLKTIESKRPTKLENDDILGYYGSFKKIAID